MVLRKSKPFMIKIIKQLGYLNPILSLKVLICGEI